MEPIFADLDEIVFEGREQAYGAYDLRRRYRQNLSRALWIVIVAFLLATVMPKVVAWAQPQPTVDVEGNRWPARDVAIIHGSICPIDWDEFHRILSSLEHPNVPKAIFLAPNPVPEDQLAASEDVFSLENLLEGTTISFDQVGEPVEDYPWEEMDQEMADAMEGSGKEEGVGGWQQDSLCTLAPVPINLHELKLMIGYPPEAYRERIEGRVVVRVKVGPKGEYLEHQVLKDPHPILTNEVTKHLKELRFSPGIQSGRPITAWITIPIRFHLFE